MDDPVVRSDDPGGEARPKGRRHLWNLVLLVPFLMLVMPWFNTVEPQLFGLPWFYWSQFCWVVVGVVAVAVVHVATRDRTGDKR